MCPFEDIRVKYPVSHVGRLFTNHTHNILSARLAKFENPKLIECSCHIYSGTVLQELIILKHELQKLGMSCEQPGPNSLGKFIMVGLGSGE